MTICTQCIVINVMLLSCYLLKGVVLYGNLPVYDAPVVHVKCGYCVTVKMNFVFLCEENN